MFMIEWFKLHRKAAITAGVILVTVALALGLSLGLTLPLKSVEMEGALVLLQGEEYTGGLNIKATTRAGLVHREEVLAGDLEGFDPSLVGEQEVSVKYKGKVAKTTVTVLASSDVTMVLREGSLPTEYLPREPFAATGVFDFYRKDTGELFRSAPVTRAAAREFDSTYSQEEPYQIKLYYSDDLWVDYAYYVPIRIASITLDNPSVALYWVEESESESSVMGQATATVTYLDGKTEKITIYSKGVSRENEPIVEEDEEGVSHEYLVFDYEGEPFKVEIHRYSRESLYKPSEVLLRLDRTVYIVGEDFDYDGAYLEVRYENFGGAPVRLRATKENIVLREAVEGGDRFVDISDGSEPITFGEAGTYLVVGREYGVDSVLGVLTAIPPESVDLVTGLATDWNGTRSGPPTKGQELDFEDATLTVTYGYGYRTETIPLTADMVSGYDPTGAGDQTLTISYGGCTLSRVFTIVDVGSDEITFMEVQNWDAPTHWSADAVEIPEGATLYVVYGYGYRSESLPVTLDMIQEGTFTPHILEDQQITILYKDQPLSFTIGMWDDRPDAEERIVAFRAPTSITIVVGDPLDLSGLCTVVYSSGREETPTLAEVLALAETLHEAHVMDGTYDTDVADTYPVRFYYPGFENSENLTWIHVEGEPAVTLTGIRLDVENAVITYAVNAPLDTTGMRLYLVYSDTHEEEVPTENINASLFEGFYTAEIGNYTAKVMYEGQMTGFDYTVADLS